MNNRCTKKITSFYKNISIKYKLLLLFYIQIIIPLIFIGYMSYEKSSAVIKDKSVTYSQDILKTIEMRLNDMADNMDALSRDLLYDRRVYDVLNYSGNEEERLNFYNNVVDLNNIMRKTVLSRNEIQSICFVSEDNNVYYFDSNSRKAKITQMMPYKDILDKAREESGKITWYLDKSNDKINNIYVARIVKNKDTFKEIGSMIILIKKDYIESLYKNLSSEAMQNIYILTNSNEKITSRNNEYSYLLDEFFKKNIKKVQGTYIDNNSKIMISYASAQNLNWMIVSFIPLKVLYREIDSLKKWIILLVLISMAILTVLSFLTAFDIIEPINKLVEGMKKVEKGQAHEDINLQRNDELGYLCGSFNKMSKKIDYLVNSIYTEQITRKEAEIKALQAQINPHFLFNTLEYINWTAQLKGVPEISETVTALARLMDANIGRDNKLIPLKEELYYIDNYISIIKSRYEDRLQVIKNVNEDVLDINIPKLLIQPLVENAVYHGIDKVTRNGIIEIKVISCENDIIAEVMDNGIGMKEEDIKILNESFTSDVSTLSSMKDSAHKSIGLQNVDRRIKLFYGDGYGLNIESVYDKYTKVEFRIPKKIVNRGGSCSE